MSYFTERHGLRAPVERTEKMTLEMYSVIYDCCEKYYENISWKYPEECPDGNGCCGMDYQKFSTAITFEIPTLFKNQNGKLDKPRRDYYDREDTFDQFALLDLIELIYAESKDISNRYWHSYYRHDDISFTNTKGCSTIFKKEINEIFDKTGLLYKLSDFGMVERVVLNSPLTKDIEAKVAQVSEKGTRELLEDAILLYKTPAPAARNDAVEKIWDALERLKTYYITLDKKKSIEKIVLDMANGKQEFATVFNDEFVALTKIGNNFRIRHHETDKIEITDARYYDYFFNRCLSLVALAIQYLM